MGIQRVPNPSPKLEVYLLLLTMPEWPEFKNLSVFLI